jgi:Peroxiredoxin
MIDIGDFGPDLGLPDQNGNPLGLYSQEIAGVSNALFFVANPDIGMLETALRRIASGFSAKASRPVAVSPLTPKQTFSAAGKAGTDFPILSDPDSRMMTAIAGGKPSKDFAAVVFDRNGRLLAAGIDDDLDALIGNASSMCADQAGIYETGVVITQAPVLLIPQVLEDIECEH